MAVHAETGVWQRKTKSESGREFFSQITIGLLVIGSIVTATFFTGIMYFENTCPIIRLECLKGPYFDLEKLAGIFFGR